MNRTSETESISICQTEQLTDRQIEDIRKLVFLCREKDHTSVSYPFEEDGVQHYLLYWNGNMAAESTAFKTGSTASGAPMLHSVLSILPYETEAECIAFTHPDWRQQGYFTELLELALETFGDCDVLFPVSGNCPDTLAALAALGAELESQELRLEISFGSEWENDHGMIYLDSGTGSNAETGICTLQSLSGSISGDCNWELQSTSTGTPTILGACQTSLVSESCICLHHLEILPQFRRNGYATALLTQLLSALRLAGIRRVILQVSGSNEAALALYKKQGFHITETLSYYLY